MIIRKIDILRVGIPFQPNGPSIPMRPGLKPRTAIESLMVRVETEDGFIGWGEAFGHFMNPGTEAVLQHVIGPWFLGRDASGIAALMDLAQRQFFSAGRNGTAYHALSAMDIALWDLLGQRSGQPLFRILGGSSGRLERYASMVRYGGNVEAIQRNCVKAAGQGYKAIKLHEHSVSAFRAARECVDRGVRIMLDVNCCWHVDEAREIAREIRDDGFWWLEEPVWPPEDYAGMARVRAEGIAVAAGENMGTPHDFLHAIQHGAIDIAQPSVIKVGGISNLLQIYALAATHGVRVVPHSPYWGPGHVASAHVAASRAEPPLIETTYVTMGAQPHTLYDLDQATFTLPELPGLGFKPDWDVFEKHMIHRAAVIT